MKKIFYNVEDFSASFRDGLFYFTLFSSEVVTRSQWSVASGQICGPIATDSRGAKRPDCRTTAHGSRRVLPYQRMIQPISNLEKLIIGSYLASKAINNKVSTSETAPWSPAPGLFILHQTISSSWKSVNYFWKMPKILVNFDRNVEVCCKRICILIHEGW